MPPLRKLAAAASLLAAAFAVGCSSSKNSPNSFDCLIGSGGSQVCAIYKNFSASSLKGLKSNCTQLGGAPVSSCPKDNQVGCCNLNLQGIQLSTCYYNPNGDAGTVGGDAGPQSAYKQQCDSEKGTWSGS